MGILDFMKSIEKATKEMESKSQSYLKDAKDVDEVRRLTSDIRRAALRESLVIDAVISSLDSEMMLRESPVARKAFNDVMASMPGRSASPPLLVSNTNYQLIFSSCDASLQSKGMLAIKEFQGGLRDSFERLDRALAGKHWGLAHCEDAMKRIDPSGVVWARYQIYRDGKDWLSAPL